MKHGMVLSISVLVLLLPVMAHAGRVLGDEELAGVRGQQPNPDLWECTPYDCSAPMNPPCQCNEALFLCIWKQVRYAERCEHPGFADACIAMLAHDDCYRVGTHTADAPCNCTDYCNDPDTGWEWTDWMGDRYSSCLDNAEGP